MVGTLTKMPVPPGLQTDRTDYATGPFWWKGSNVRFENGDVEKIGGSTVETDYTFTGSASNKKVWSALDGTQYLAVGTEQKLEIVKDGKKYDITPIASTSALGLDPFTMVSGSALVTITDTGHPAVAGDWIELSGAAMAHGVTLDGSYRIVSKTDANNYVVEHSVAATSSGNGGGGTVSIDYLLATGNVGSPGHGWGAGSWGSTGSGWGSPATAGVTVEPTTWSLDTWGEDLVACRRGGTIYHWDESVGTGTRAAAITNAPSTCLFIKVTETDRHLVAFGAHNGTTGDNLNIAWPDQETLTDWTPTATNTAGSIRAERGTKLVGVDFISGGMGVLTDEALYSLRYVGTPYTFGLKILGKGCGAVAQNAIITYNDTLYWMSERDFYGYRGTVKTLPCSVHDEVFDNVEDVAEPLFFAGSNRLFNEVVFFYVPRGQDNISRYASVNVLDGTWSLGSSSRTTWSDETVWVDAPLAIDADGTLHYHETGVDNGSSALPAYVESGVIELRNTEYKTGTSGSGDYLIQVDRFIPDTVLTGSLSLTVYFAKYPNGPEGTKGPFTITNSTDKINLRVKGRQIRIRLESTALGDSWRFGVPRIRVKQSGRR